MTHYTTFLSMVCTYSGGQLKKAEEMDLRGPVGERGDHPLHSIKYRVEDEPWRSPKKPPNFVVLMSPVNPIGLTEDNVRAPA